MYKKMLVLLDGSELAEVVFRYARELAGRLDIDLDLLHVVTPQEHQQLPMRRAYIERMAEVLCAEAQEVSASASPDAVQSCILARGTVVVGNPAEEILKYVDENDIDLVMLSTRGQSGLKFWDIGSIANKVIHAAKVPVWLVPAELREEIVQDTLPVRRLVIPLSGSKISEAVIPYALDMARQRGAETEIVLIYADDVQDIIVSRDALHAKEAERAKVRAYMEGVADSIRAQGFSARAEMLIGDPAEAIIEYIKNNPPQLIAMSTRGRRGLSKMVFGSITEEVIHHIKKTPMLLVSSVDQGA
jgi:nucleotide-binding universal stress UspA family protein